MRGQDPAASKGDSPASDPVVQEGLKVEELLSNKPCLGDDSSSTLDGAGTPSSIQDTAQNGAVLDDSAVNSGSEGVSDDGSYADSGSFKFVVSGPSNEGSHTCTPAALTSAPYAHDLGTVSSLEQAAGSHTPLEDPPSISAPQPLSAPLSTLDADELENGSHQERPAWSHPSPQDQPSTSSAQPTSTIDADDHWGSSDTEQHLHQHLQDQPSTSAAQPDGTWDRHPHPHQQPHPQPHQPHDQLSRSSTAHLDADNRTSSVDTRRSISRTTTQGEDDSSLRWQQRKRHFFILTSAGKPVFSRYGDEHALAGFMAVIQAMMSVMQEQGEKLQSMTTSTHVIAFATHGPLYMVAVSAVAEPPASLQRQLYCLYQQIIFIVTTSLERVCQRNASYDVRGLLGGSWATLRAMIRGFSRDVGWLVEAFPPLPMPAPERRDVAEALQEAVKASGAMYGIILAEGLVVAVERLKHAPIHPLDMQLLINFIRSNESYRYRFGESFSPVCLPNFQAKAFLHAYIRYLDPEAGLCLALLSPSSEAFYALSEARAALEERLAAGGLLATMRRRIMDPAAGCLPLDVLPKAAGGGMAGNTPLWHFVLKLAGRSQYVSPALREPLESPQLCKDMVRALARVHCAVWQGAATGAAPRRVHWQADSHLAMLAMVDREAELYLVLDPLTDKAGAVKLSEALRKFLLEKTRAADIFLLA